MMYHHWYHSERGFRESETLLLKMLQQGHNVITHLGVGDKDYWSNQRK